MIKHTESIKVNSKLQVPGTSLYFLGLLLDDCTKLVMCKYAPNQYFDVKYSPTISDSVCLKRVCIENKGIKTFCVHEGHLIVATFKK